MRNRARVSLPALFYCSEQLGLFTNMYGSNIAPGDIFSGFCGSLTGPIPFGDERPAVMVFQDVVVVFGVVGASIEKHNGIIAKELEATRQANREKKHNRKACSSFQRSNDRERSVSNASVRQFSQIYTFNLDTTRREKVWLRESMAKRGSLGLRALIAICRSSYKLCQFLWSGWTDWLIGKMKKWVN